MYFIVDDKVKLIIGWSAKCGCTHIKRIIRYMQTNKEQLEIYQHSSADRNNLPTNYTEYTWIIIVRNPYERVVSGFLDCYVKRKWKWIDQPLTFSNFVNELEKSNNKIDKHHFECQMLNSPTNISSIKNMHICDLKKIDYSIIENIYNKKIPDSYINFYGSHAISTAHCTKIMTQVSYDIVFDETTKHSLKTPPRLFYNEKLKQQIKKIYKLDFDFFESIEHLNYSI